MQFEYAGFMVYLGAAQLIKMSILVFLHRLTVPNTKARQMIVAIHILTIPIFIGTAFTATFACSPIASSWNLKTRVYNSTHCISIWGSFMGWSVVGALVDSTIVAMPIYLVLKLKLARSTQFGLVFVFSCGFVATAAAIAKAVTIKTAYDGFDPSWDFVPVLLAAHLEICFGIIVASLPALNSWYVRTMPAKFLPKPVLAHKPIRNPFRSTENTLPTSNTLGNDLSQGTRKSFPTSGETKYSMTNFVQTQNSLSPDWMPLQNLEKKGQHPWRDKKKAVDDRSVYTDSQESLELVLQRPESRNRSSL
jgi:hypothetical protein